MPPPAHRRRVLLHAAAAAAGLTTALPRRAAAQPDSAAAGFPARPVRVVVPFSPGGQSDSVMRLLAPGMGAALGQPIVVENRTGAGGAVGAGLVAQAPPDGHTLLFDSVTFVVVPLVAKGLGFSYETAFAPVSQAVALPYVLVVRREFPPPHTLAGFVAEARARPGAVTYGTPGIGSLGHLAGAMLERAAGVRLEHVPYRGGQDAARDLAAGTLDAVIGTANTLRPLVEDGRAHGVALTSAERRGSMAHLPTVAEQGYPGFDATSWNGLFAPAGTPPAVVARLAAAVAAAAREPETARRPALTGNEPVAEGPEAFAARIARDREAVRRIVAETGMRLE